MSGLTSIRRSVAIGFRWVVAVVGVAAMFFSPVATVLSNLSAGVTLLVVGILAVALSIQMARSLDIQRRLRKLGAEHAAAMAKQREVALSAESPGAPGSPKKSAAPVPPGSAVTPGQLLSGDGAKRLPVIGFDLTGMSEQQIRCAVDSIAAHQLVTASFKPLILLDRPEFAPMRAYGYLAELLIASDEWQGDPRERIVYIRRRLDSIQKTYAPSTIIRPGPDGLDEVTTVMLEGTVAEWAMKYETALPRDAINNAKARSPQERSYDALPTT